MNCSECGEPVSGAPRHCPYCAAALAVGAGVLLLRNPAPQKSEMIKLIRELAGLGLREAKALVERAPCEIATGLEAESADRWRRRFEAAGATVESRAGPESHVETGAALFLTNAGRNPIAVFRLIRELTGLGLAEAKRLAESAPCPVKGSLKLHQAREVRSRFEEIGARAEIR